MRVFGHAVAVAALEQVVAKLSAGPLSAEVMERGSIIITLDGKTLRGTIPVGRTGGSPAGAYQAKPGLIRTQVAVDAKANEIVATPTVVEKLDLTGVVIS
jgi:hypothetical protein